MSIPCSVDRTDTWVGIDDSLSGSESSEENLSEEDSDAVATLVNRRKQTRASRSPSPSHISRPQTPLLWFHSADPPPTQIGVYRILFPTDSQPLDTLKEFQTRKARTWALFMVAGGHFAGAIVRVSREEREESTAKKPKRPQPELEVLLHKTFHRYTSGLVPSLHDRRLFLHSPSEAGRLAVRKRQCERKCQERRCNITAIWRTSSARCEC